MLHRELVWGADKSIFRHQKAAFYLQLQGRKPSLSAPSNRFWLESQSQAEEFYDLLKRALPFDCKVTGSSQVCWNLRSFSAV
jgi:hypothetical protein